MFASGAQSIFSPKMAEGQVHMRTGSTALSPAHNSHLLRSRVQVIGRGTGEVPLCSIMPPGRIPGFIGLS